MKNANSKLHGNLFFYSTSLSHKIPNFRYCLLSQDFSSLQLNNIKLIQSQAYENQINQRTRNTRFTR